MSTTFFRHPAESSNLIRQVRSKVVPLVVVMVTALSVVSAQADFSYSYGHPQTPLNDGYITSTSNAVLYSEGPVRCWKPDVGGTTFGNTTPGIINYHFNFGQATSDISLWMNMPTFHWSYSRGHNFLHGSTDGVNWTQLAEVTPPPFGSAHDLGTVNIPQSFIGTDELFLRVELYSYGSSAPSGGVFTNTSQLSRYDVNIQNTAFSLNATFVPEPSAAILCGACGVVGLACMRRRRK